METIAAADLDAWLRSGGLVVTASERAARALLASFHRARRAEGHASWPAPAIQPWSDFVRSAWQQRALDGRLILNPVQEESLWAEIIASRSQSEIPLEGPRYRAARLAMQAHALLCAYAPELLRPRPRSTWQQDAAAFSNWLNGFDEACRTGNLISTARLPLELIPLLEASLDENGPISRPSLLLAGFDRIQPVQRRLFDVWGAWTETKPANSARTNVVVVPGHASETPATISNGITGAPGLASETWDGVPRFSEARDTQSELAACAIWCRCRLDARPGERLLVISHEAAMRRGEIERAFLRHLGSDALFEFTLGVPLDQVPLIHCAHLLLRWLVVPLAEHEVDWLFASGYAAGPQESAALQSAMRSFRRRSLEQPDWPLDIFLAQCRGLKPDSLAFAAAWRDRMAQARQRVADYARQTHSPLDCAEFASQLLEALGWPAARSLSSAEFQAAQRFQNAIETAASLGFDGRRVAWQDYLSSLARILNEALFAPESRDAPVQLAGPAESAGLSADAIWFLGASEDAWPPSATMHPLLPVHVQRQFSMPHASPQDDWDLARTITARLLASAPEVHFSYAQHAEGVESRASRLVERFAGAPQPLAPELAIPAVPAPLTVDFVDTSLVAYPPGKVGGGATVLTYQSQCPFKAFAAVRLAAQSWNPAQPSLTPAQRGKLLHAVMHAIWAGPPDGLRNLHDLESLSDRPSFIAAHIRRAFQREVGGHLRARMPNAYLELEEQRLGRLLSEWLGYESTRVNFEVLKTEDKRTVHLAGLTFELRLDRIDRLNDGTLLVIDYKTGDVTPKAWDPPRPDDVQLPLYAAFALDAETEELGGLTFARVQTGKICFSGRIGDAHGTLLSSLGSRDALVREPFSAEMLLDWRERVEQLARDFLTGRAHVDPREYPQTCERCDLQGLCRIHETAARLVDEEIGSDAELAEAADE